MNLYSFEYGSGSLWGSYLLPADGYKLSVHRDGKICLGSVVPSSVEFNGVKNLKAIGSAQFRRAVAATLKTKEKTV